MFFALLSSTYSCHSSYSLIHCDQLSLLLGMGAEGGVSRANRDDILTRDRESRVCTCGEKKERKKRGLAQKEKRDKRGWRKEYSEWW